MSTPDVPARPRPAVVLASAWSATVLADRFRIPSLLLFLGLGHGPAPTNGLNSLALLTTLRLAEHEPHVRSPSAVILFDGGLSTGRPGPWPSSRASSALATRRRRS